MKRVRYLVGAAGLAPMALGAAAGGTHAAAEGIGGHAKTVALHGALGPRGQIPDINYVNCSRPGDWLEVHHSNGRIDCYANAGHETLLTYRFDYVFTGNNGAKITLYQSGIRHTCRQSYKNSYIFASSCGGTWSRGALVFLSIFPGK